MNDVLQRRLPLLVVGLALIIFPLGWLGELWQPFGLLIDRLFPTAWAHAVGHAGLFGLLGQLLLWMFPALRGRPVLYLVLLVAVGVCQEGGQALFKGGVQWFDSVRDIGTDLLGGVMALGLAWLVHASDGNRGPSPS
jgi:hypothetical protein